MFDWIESEKKKFVRILLNLFDAFGKVVTKFCKFYLDWESCLYQDRSLWDRGKSFSHIHFTQFGLARLQNVEKFPQAFRNFEHLSWYSPRFFLTFRKICEIFRFYFYSIFFKHPEQTAREEIAFSRCNLLRCKLEDVRLKSNRFYCLFSTIPRWVFQG